METHPTASKHCLNCGYALPQNATYCPNCSQKDTDGRITMRSFLANTWETIFNIDSKIFRTLRDIFVPGKLTEEFFKGKHQSYLHPARFFLAVTVVLIAALHFNTERDEDGSTMVTEIKKEIAVQQLKLKADTIRQEMYIEYPKAVPVIDSFYARLVSSDSIYTDSTLIADVFYSDSLLTFTTDKPVSFKKEEFVTLSADELVEKYFSERSFISKLLSKQMIRVMKQGGQFLPYLIDKISWLMLLSLPFFAILLKLLYWRKDLYYVEHLVFTIHIHTFLFLLWALSIAFSRWVGFLPFALFTLAGVYVLFAMKRIYKQRWRTTLFKFGFSNFMYWIIVGFAAIITGLISFLLF